MELFPLAGVNGRFTEEKRQLQALSARVTDVRQLFASLTDRYAVACEDFRDEEDMPAELRTFFTAKLAEITRESRTIGRALLALHGELRTEIFHPTHREEDGITLLRNTCRSLHGLLPYGPPQTVFYQFENQRQNSRSHP